MRVESKRSTRLSTVELIRATNNLLLPMPNFGAHASFFSSDFSTTGAPTPRHTSLRRVCGTIGETIYLEVQVLTRFQAMDHPDCFKMGLMSPIRPIICSFDH